MLKFNKGSKNFWLKVSNNLIWSKEPKKAYSVNKSNQYFFYPDGKLDLYKNLISKNNQNQVAIITIDKNGIFKNYTYGKIDYLVGKFTYFLNKKKIKKVIIHSSASINSACAMLACIKLGIFFSVIFDDLPKAAIEKRLEIFSPDLILTNSKLKFLNFRKKIFLFKDIFNSKRNSKTKSKILSSKNKFFCLFTSGTTGQPKGVVHSYGGYSVYCKYTCLKKFGMNKDSLVLTASDAAWINGHTYSLFGPLLFGAKTILLEKPQLLLNYQILKKVLSLGVTILYLPVTLIRLMKSIYPKKKFKFTKLETIGSMGEPLASEVGSWYEKYFLNKGKSIINTYFQTETGGIISSPSFKESCKFSPHGSVGKIVTNHISTNLLSKTKKNEIKITKPWPGMMTNIINGKKYWKRYWDNNKNFRMFDLATKKNNSLYIHGRLDDVINIRGHRIGSEEVESVVLENKNIIECCAISSEDYYQGHIFYIFYVGKILIDDNKIIKAIKNNFGTYAIPSNIIALNELPKTKSGKILRRLLRDLINHNNLNEKDLSTINNINIIKDIKNKIKESHEK